MDRIPFGIRRLDTTIGGGAPPGSVVLLSGQAGAGAREFMYTAAVMNGLADSDRELFNLYYGVVARSSSDYAGRPGRRRRQRRRGHRC